MALQFVNTKTVTFGVGDRQDFTRVDLPAGETRLFYLDTDPQGIVLKKAYLNVYAQFSAPGTPISTPLLLKYFPTTTRVLFLLPILQLRTNPVQRVTIYTQPKEFFPGSAGIKKLKVSLFYENATTYPLGVLLPSA